jgi:hypothetical protein
MLVSPSSTRSGMPRLVARAKTHPGCAQFRRAGVLLDQRQVDAGSARRRFRRCAAPASSEQARPGEPNALEAEPPDSVVSHRSFPQTLVRGPQQSPRTTAGRSEGRVRDLADSVSAKGEPQVAVNGARVRIPPDLRRPHAGRMLPSALVMGRTVPVAYRNRGLGRRPD